MVAVLFQTRYAEWEVHVEISFLTQSPGPSAQQNSNLGRHMEMHPSLWHFVQSDGSTRASIQGCWQGCQVLKHRIEPVHGRLYKSEMMNLKHLASNTYNECAGHLQHLCPILRSFSLQTLQCLQTAGDTTSATSPFARFSLWLVTPVAPAVGTIGLELLSWSVPVETLS